MSMLRTQSRGPFRAVIDGSTYSTALALPGPSAALRAAASGASGMISTQDASCARFIHGGTDAENEMFTVWYLLWYKFEAAGGMFAFIPVVAYQGTVTLGAMTYGTGGAAMGTSTNLLADTLANAAQLDTGVFEDGAVADSVAMLEIDVHNADYIEVLVSNNGKTAASMDVFMQLGEARGIASVLGGL
jgi:hypothetical protein